MLEKYPPRNENPEEFAFEYRVLLLKTDSGIDMDVSLGGISFEELVVQRSKLIEILPKIRLRICSAEDLIVLKAFASREIDWQDVRGVIVRQGANNLNWAYVEEQLTPLVNVKGSPEILDKLKELKESA